MAKKFIDVMDTTFRDGFQSVFGARVLMDDFLPAVSAARDAGINHFEFGGGARFQSLYFYLNEDAFVMMDKFREVTGKDANLQTLSRGVNTVTLDTGSRELVDLHAKLFAKHGTTTIRNFDALNDVKNLEYSAQRIKQHSLKQEVVVKKLLFYNYIFCAVYRGKPGQGIRKAAEPFVFAKQTRMKRTAEP